MKPMIADDKHDRAMRNGVPVTPNSYRRTISRRVLGFLPKMTTGNWIFWAILVWIGVNFLWLAFVEQYVPQYVGAIIATLIAVFVLWFGPRPFEDDEAEEEEEQSWQA